MIRFQLFVVLLLAAAAVAKPADEVTTSSLDIDSNNFENADISTTAAPTDILSQQSGEINNGQSEDSLAQTISGRTLGGSVTILGDQVRSPVHICHAKRHEKQ